MFHNSMSTVNYNESVTLPMPEEPSLDFPSPPTTDIKESVPQQVDYERQQISMRNDPNFGMV